MLVVDCADPSKAVLKKKGRSRMGASLFTMSHQGLEP